MSFKLDHHNKIITILAALRSEYLVEIGAYFGGGTLLALQYGEYRWSQDVDFICPVGKGYSQLRADLFDKGYKTLFSDISSISLPREFKADQYGVRFAVEVDELLIKFEIIAEGRITLDPPVYSDWSLVPCLSYEDSCTEKLLSNADRWNDQAVLSRDLIDLALLRTESEFKVSIYNKAELAYPVVPPLVKAIKSFQDNPKYRKKCFSALQITNLTRILDGIDLLATDHELPVYVRTLSESL